MARRKGRIIRFEDWERRFNKGLPLCDMKPSLKCHRIGELYYFSFFRRTKSGKPFTEIKQSADDTAVFSSQAVYFLRKLVLNLDGWCIVTTPRRRSGEGMHFASEVCSRIADEIGIPFYDNAVCCVNRKRIEPDFILLRPIPERRVIVFDDIITTGSTLKATVESLGERDIIVNLIGINNR